MSPVLDSGPRGSLTLTTTDSHEELNGSESAVVDQRNKRPAGWRPSNVDPDHKLDLKNRTQTISVDPDRHLDLD